MNKNIIKIALIVIALLVLVAIYFDFGHIDNPIGH